MQKEIKEAVTALKKGGIILIPTETVYGIAADATNKNAIRKIYEIKQRDASKPLQLLVKNLAEASKYALFNEPSRKAAETYWPGPLTLILDEIKGNNLAQNLNSNDGTIGVRVPKHEILDELFNKIGFPLAATSANLSGEKPFTGFEEAKTFFNNKLDYFLDGGNIKLQEPSAILDMRDERCIKTIRKNATILHHTL